MLAELPGAAATAAAAATSFDQRCAVCVVRSEELTEGYRIVTEFVRILAHNPSFISHVLLEKQAILSFISGGLRNRKSRWRIWVEDPKYRTPLSFISVYCDSTT